MQSSRVFMTESRFLGCPAMMVDTLRHYDHSTESHAPSLPDSPQSSGPCTNSPLLLTRCEESSAPSNAGTGTMNLRSFAHSLQSLTGMPVLNYPKWKHLQVHEGCEVSEHLHPLHATSRNLPNWAAKPAMKQLMPRVYMAKLCDMPAHDRFAMEKLPAAGLHSCCTACVGDWPLCFKCFS